MDMVNVTIDGVSVQVPSNYTVLEAAKKAGVKIPTLCYLKDVNEVGACRVCLVEVEKARALAAACVMPVSEGMVVHTNSKKVRDTRKATLEMILSDHNRDCLSCIRNQNCELQTLAEEYGIRKVTFEGEKSPSVFDDKSFSIVRDGSKCVKCGRCVSACKKQGIGVLSFLNRGFSTSVGPAYDISMADAPCIYCGQCIVACPVGALHEKEETDKVWAAIQDPSKHVVMQVAPAVRAAIGEEFGLPIGTRATGKMFAAMKRLGADKVYDTNWGADLTIALIKSYYAKNNNLDPKDIVVVSVMPCTSKKTEAAREQLVNADGLKDVDIVITTRELARMIREAGMDFNSLPDEGPDQDLMGEYTGAAVIFGATGGVMEAAVRTVADILEEKDLPEFEYKAVRGVEADIKEAELTLGGKNIRVAVAHSTAAARKLLDSIKDGSAPEYTFIEIMGCSGGCVCGGGQPQVPAQKLMDIDIRAERAKALYEEDAIMPQRKSHKNSQIDKLYKEFLGAPNGHLAHELLHTTYAKREIYPDSILEE